MIKIIFLFTLFYKNNYLYSGHTYNYLLLFLYFNFSYYIYNLNFKYNTKIAYTGCKKEYKN